MSNSGGIGTDKCRVEQLEEQLAQAEKDAADMSAELCDLQQELGAARRSLSEGISACEWTSDYPDEEPAVIATSLTSGCGHEWMGDGEVDPPGRWMKFCPFCGGKTPFSEVPK